MRSDRRRCWRGSGTRRSTRATPVGALRPAAQQIVSIARALSYDVRLLIMDEPSAILDEREIETLFEVVRRLTARGRRRRLHLPPPRRDPADRRPGDGAADGATAADRPARRHPDRRAGRAMVGRKVEQLFPERPRGRRRGPARGPRPQAAADGARRQPRGAGRRDRSASAAWSAPAAPSCCG